MWKRKSKLQTRFSYKVMSLRNTAVWNTVPDPKRTGGRWGAERGGRARIHVGLQEFLKQASKAEHGEKMRRTCLLTIFKCANGEINTRNFFADRMCFPYF